MALNASDIEKIGEVCMTVMKSTGVLPAVSDPVEQNVVELDPMLKVIDRVQEQAMADLPTGIVAYRGRNGTQVVNHSEETLNTLDNFRRNRKNFRTRQTVR